MAFSEAVKHPSTPVELSPAGNEPLNTLEVCAGDSVRDGLKGNSFVVEKYLDALCRQFIWKQIGKVTTTGVSKRMCQKDFDDLMASSFMAARNSDPSLKCRRSVGSPCRAYFT